MDEAAIIKYVALRCFCRPMARTGISFALLAFRGGDNGVVIREALEWRGNANSQDMSYLEALLLSFLVDTYADALLAELVGMSAGPRPGGGSRVHSVPRLS
jgi:hypothetical protein